MSIDLRKFVDINIQKRASTTISGIRDTVVLFTSFGTKGTAKTIKNLSEAYNNYSEDTDTYAYLKMFFDNGGVQVIVYEGYSKLTADDITELDNKYICVAAVGINETILRSIATTVASNTYGINEKIILARTTTKTKDENSIKNYAIKYSTVIGAEMTMAAYLSKINTHDTNSVFDYAFTQESLTAEDSLTNDEFDILMSNNVNVNITLANQSRVCGGNCKDGSELTNNYVRIILHQTLTDALIQTLVQKLASSTGLAKIYTTIATEMNYYLRNGYLSIDKIWSDSAWKVSTNDQTYTIIEQGTPLTNGYIAKVLPMSSLTSTEKTEHKTPKIYIAIADQYAIRKIEITGEVI